MKFGSGIFYRRRRESVKLCENQFIDRDTSLEGATWLLAVFSLLASSPIWDEFDTESIYLIPSSNNINSQLDATITNFIDNYNQLDMFRAIISPILRSTRLCLQLVV